MRMDKNNRKIRKMFDYPKDKNNYEGVQTGQKDLNEVKIEVKP